MKKVLNNKTLIALTFVLVATPVIGQQAFDGTTLLHEFTEPVSSRGTGNASAKKNNGIPTLSADVQNDEPIFDGKGPQFSEAQNKPYGDLSPFGTTNRLDNRTDRVKTLDYFANFTPSVIPYKRSVSQNKIHKNGDTYEFSVRSKAITKVPTRSDSSGESFWGSFLIRAEKSQLHPLPSIAPNQEILLIQTEPEVDVEIFRDGADNFSAKIDGEGLIRVNIKYTVPSSYFSGAFPETEWDKFDNSKVSELPSSVMKVAERVRGHIGLSNSLSPVQNLNTMVEHFRNFEARAFPDALKIGDLYEQISKNQIGVCRHRSLAFMITANSMGIPTRYVYNEAHAFVEVHWPKTGWRRIDLGGAADQMNAATNDGRDLHQTTPDTLPQPEEFIKEQSRMRTDFGEAPTGNESEGANNGEASESGQTTNSVSSLEGKNLVEKEVDPEDPRMVPTLKILSASSTAKRGGLVRVIAKLNSVNGPVEGRKISAFLGPAGHTNISNATLIGHSTSDRSGRITVEFTIPADQDIGRWELFLFFKGDQEFGPALSD